MTEDWKKRFEEARRRHYEQKHATGQLTALNIRPMRLPDDVFERLGGKRTAQEVRYTCAECRESPEPQRCMNGYVPGQCKCQREKIRLAREQHERMEQWKHQQEVTRRRCERCYTWLGREWSDEGMEGYTFETFDPAFQSEALLVAIAFSKALRGNLVFWIDHSWGTGKTHLAVAICNLLLSQRTPCLFTTAQNMFNAFGARIDNHQGYSDLLAMAGEYPLLVIDDLDKVHLTCYKQSIFFEVVDKRYKRRLPTVITTNEHVEVTDDDVVGISEYVGRAAASRLCDVANGGLITQEMNGVDYRRRKR